MSVYALNSAIVDIAHAIKELALAVDRGNSIRKSEPIFIFVPSDIKPEDAKRMGTILRDAFRGT